MRISIVGMQFVDAEAFVATLPNGATLVLQRDPLNKFDKNAVAVFYAGRKIGYLPKAKNREVAEFLDQHGKPPMAQDAAITGNATTATLARSPNSGYPMADITLEQSNVERTAATGPAGAGGAPEAKGKDQGGGKAEG